MKMPGHPKLALLAALLLALPLFAGAAAHAEEALPAADLGVVTPDDPADGDIVESLDSGAVYQCIQITVWARDPETGECQEFPNPCSVPEGWEKFFDPETCANG